MRNMAMKIVSDNRLYLSIRLIWDPILDQINTKPKLPPASEEWGKVVYSEVYVCSHFREGGTPIWLTRDEGYPLPSWLGGRGTPSFPMGRGYPHSSQWGTPIPGQDGGGYPHPRSGEGGYPIPSHVPWQKGWGGGVFPQPEQHSMYFLRSWRYVSCVHAGGLSCLPIWTKMRIVDVRFLTHVAHLGTTGAGHHVATFRLEKPFLTLPARADHCLCDLVLYERPHVRLSCQSAKFKLEISIVNLFVTDHVRSTKDGNVFSLICDSVYVGGGRPSVTS